MQTHDLNFQLLIMALKLLKILQKLMPIGKFAQRRGALNCFCCYFYDKH